MNIFDLFQAPIIAAFWEVKSQDAQTYFLEYFFPNDKQLGLKLEWIKGAYSTPVILKQSNFDADPTYRDLEGIAAQETELPLFREGFLIKEQDQRDLMNLLAANNDKAKEIVLNRIYNQSTTLIEAAAVTREYERSQVFTTGKLDLVGNGVSFKYDYSLASSQKVKTSVAWATKATATPLADLTKWADDAATRCGERPTIAVMNTVTFNEMLATTEVKTLFKDYQLGVPSAARLKTYILDDLQLKVVIYDKQFKKTKGTTAVKYIPDHTVVLTPDMELGKTMFGTTSEEYALTSSPTANVAVVDTGVAITSEIVKNIPLKIQIVASQIVCPTFEGGEYITIANTAA